MTPVDGDGLVEAKRTEQLGRKKEVSRRFTVINLVANGALALAKGIVAVMTGSLVISADAFNSLADTGYSLVLAVGMWFSLRPADGSHPRGHRGLEPLISLVIGISIAVVAIRIFIRGLTGLSDPPAVVYSGIAVAVLLATIAVKLVLTFLARRSADEISAPALRAAGDDAKADVMASAVALAGYTGGWVGWDLADPIFSLIVAGFVGRTAFEVLKENTGYILGKSASAEIERRVVETACSPEMVCAVHDLKAYHVGPELHVSFHLEVNRQETLETVHDLEQRVRLAILDLPEVDDVILHIDPVIMDGEEEA